MHKRTGKKKTNKVQNFHMPGKDSTRSISDEPFSKKKQKSKIYTKQSRETETQQDIAV